MKKRIADIVTEFSVEGLAAVQAALKKLAKEVRESGAKSETLDRNMQNTAASADRASTSVDGIGDAADRASVSTSNLGDDLDDAAVSADRAASSIEDVDTSAGEASKSIDASSDSMDDLADSAHRASGETDDLARNVDRIAPSASETADAIEDVAVAAERAAPHVDQIDDGLATASGSARDTAEAVDRIGDGATDASRSIDRIDDSLGTAARSADHVDDALVSVGASAGDAARDAERIGDAVQDVVPSARRSAAALGDVSQAATVTADAIVDVPVVLGESDRRSTVLGRSLGRVGAVVRSLVASLRTVSSNALGRLGAAPAALLATFRAFAAYVAASLSSLGGRVATFSGLVGQALGSMARMGRVAFSRVSSSARRAFRSLRSPLSAFRSRVASVASVVAGAIGAVPALLGSAILAATTSLSGAATGIVRSIANVLAVSFGAVVSGLSRMGGVATRFGSTAGRVLSGIGPVVVTAFRGAGALATTTLAAMGRGLTTFGGLAGRTFRGMQTAVGSAGRVLGAGFAAGARLAGAALSGLGRAGLAGLRGLPRAISAVARGFAGLARAGAAAFRGIGTAAAGVARGIVSAFAGVGKSILSVLTSKAGLITAAGLGLGNLTVKAATSFAPLLGLAGGAAGALAGVVTMKDVEAVRQLADALDMPPQTISQWQFMGAAVGAASDDVLGALQTMSTTMTGIAAGDEAMERVAGIFKIMGISVSNANGEFKTTSQMLTELALRSRFWTSQERNHIFSAIFGEADALKLSTLFRDVGNDYTRLQTKMRTNAAKGLLITPEQIRTLAAFQRGWGELLFTLKAFARDLFLAFEPIFSSFVRFANLKLEMPGQRGDIVQKLFVKPFERALQLTNDIMKAWWGFNFSEWFTGVSDGGVSPENLWLYDVKKAAVDVWSILQGLIQLAYGAAEAFVSLFRAFDALGTSLTGFSMEDWLLGSFASDFEAFARDFRVVLASLFDAPIDTSNLTTVFGRFVGDAVENVKSVISPIWRAVVDDLVGGWGEFQKALADGSGLTGVETFTGAFLILVRDVVADLRELGEAVWKVFVDDAPAPKGYEWLTTLKTIVDEVVTVLKDLSSLFVSLGDNLGPSYDKLNSISQSLLGISAATTVLLGGGLLRLGGIFAGFAAALAGPTIVAAAGALASLAVPLAPIVAAIVAIGGGLYILYNLLTDFTGTIDRIVGGLKSAYAVFAGDDSGDPGLFGMLGQHLGVSEPWDQTIRRQMDNDLAAAEAKKAGLPPPRERTQMTEWLEQSYAQEAASIAKTERVEAATVAETAMIEAGNVEIKSSGRPVILNLADTDVALQGAQDEVDKLMRSRSLTAGGTR